MSSTTQALKPVIVVGAGTMGNCIAQTFAFEGHTGETVPRAPSSIQPIREDAEMSSGQYASRPSV